MKIELRNVKHAAFASEETSCFEATVYLNGLKAGGVQNDGRGGANRYYPWTIKETLDAYGKTLPKLITKYKRPDGGFYELDQDADILIGEQLTRTLESKRLKAMLRNKIVMLDAGKIYTLKQPTILSEVKSRFPSATILNELPFEKALDVFLTNT